MSTVDSRLDPLAMHDETWAAAAVQMPRAKRGNGHIDDLAFYTSVYGWLAREIPEPEFLLGEVLSNTTRGMLVADTGVGKTNFVLELAACMAGKRGFGHWLGPAKPVRVLFLEGEMSRRVVKSRIQDVVRRAGSPPSTLYIVSRSDPKFADLPPLNTEAGQQYVDGLISRLGGVDFSFFDNVQALLTGDMKDEEPWQQTLPWIRDLTNRSIGQLWVHHTGHDTSRSYGTKTREWQLVVVMLAEPVQRAGADIAFSLKFTKARERAPHNRTDFEPATVILANDHWLVEGSSTAKRRGKPSPLGQKFYSALLDTIAAAGRPSSASGRRVAATRNAWFSECVRVGLLDQDDDERAQKSNRALFSKYRRELIEMDWIACNGDLAWQIDQ
jgi:hypothetical protein